MDNKTQFTLPPYKDKWQEAIKKLMRSGKCMRFNDIIIKNSKYEYFDEYTRVALTVKAHLPALVSDNGFFHEGTSNIIYTSSYAIACVFKEDVMLSWMSSSIIEHPHIIPLLLNGSTIDVIVQKVAKGEEYINPFATKEDPMPTKFDDDIFVKYIVNVKLGRTGERMSDKLAEKLMGF
mgnify:CR=1 FL=1